AARYSRQTILPYLLRHRATRNSAYQLSSPRRRDPYAVSWRYGRSGAQSKCPGLWVPACAGTTVERSGEILYSPGNLAACSLAGSEYKNFKNFKMWEEFRCDAPPP